MADLMAYEADEKGSFKFWLIAVAVGFLVIYAAAGLALLFGSKAGALAFLKEFDSELRTPIGMLGYAVLGSLASLIIYRRTKTPDLKLRLSCAVWALFFSCSILFNKIFIAYLPTTVGIMAMGIEIAYPEPCLPTSEGCMPAQSPDIWVISAFLVQWALWYIIFMVVRFAVQSLNQFRMNRPDK